MNAALKQFRTDLGLKQSEIAEKIGFSRSVYGYVEHGKRAGTLDFWHSLQKVFNVPIEVLWALQKSDIKAYNQKIFKDEECKKWFEEVRLNNARK